MAYPEILMPDDDPEAGDYAAIRSLLGLSTFDLTDDLIALPTFGPQAERDIMDRVGEERWAVIYGSGGDDAMQQERLRLAAMYWTAALLAETWALGGTIGNVRPAEEKHDWPATAGRLRAKAHEWLGRVLDADGPDQADEFDVRIMRVSGPTRARNIAAGIPARRWFAYPPVVGVPPWET